MLFDGLDEAPDRVGREKVARVFENAARRWQACRFVVTTRPRAHFGTSILKDFFEARIEPLSDGAISTFLGYWCRGVFPDSRQRADQHQRELEEAMIVRPDIRLMARTPVMLTALAVLHWNERRLPEKRSELYGAILTWLSRQRESRPGRERAERSLSLLQELALDMQSHPSGRQVRVALGWAAEALAPQFTLRPERERFPRAIQFLEEETSDSGIIMERSGDLQFWHLTFQEYLAAQAIAGRTDADQQRLLLGDDSEQFPRIYQSQWREVLLLLAGILQTKQGKAKVDALVSAILASVGEKLTDQARAASVLDAMIQDLQPLAYKPVEPKYGLLYGRCAWYF